MKEEEEEEEEERGLIKDLAKAGIETEIAHAPSGEVEQAVGMCGANTGIESSTHESPVRLGRRRDSLTP